MLVKSGMSLFSDAERWAARAGAQLRRAGERVACAESCTGGGIAAALTAIPGSSEWFWGGIVSYSIDSKTALLGVPASLIERYGAVSEPVAQAMAAGALERSPADHALAVTGIAGPGGGEPLQPVGTVWFAWLARDGRYRQCARERFEGDRAAVRSAATTRALAGLCTLLSEHRR